MLKKLLKYDIKSLFKFLSIFYIITIFFGILTRLFLSIENSFILNVIGKICNGIMIAGFFNIVINSLMRPWVKFKNNFYNDESYLTHTLPVSKKDLYLSKLISSLLSLFASICVIILTILIAYYSKENFQNFIDALIPLKNLYGNDMIFIIITFVLVVFIEFANTLQIGYTGILLGHKMNNMKIMFSVIYGFIAHLILQTLTVLSLLILGIFNRDIFNIFFSSDQPSLNLVKTILYFGAFIYTLLFVFEYLFNQHIFKQGVDVD